MGKVLPRRKQAASGQTETGIESKSDPKTKKPSGLTDF